MDTKTSIDQPGEEPQKIEALDKKESLSKKNRINKEKINPFSEENTDNFKN